MTAHSVEGASVLVTGGAGYIGSHVALALRDRGRRVVILDDLSTGYRAAVAPGAPFYEGRVDDAALVARIAAENQVEAVVHLAGSISVPDSVRDPLTYYANNTVASLALARACLQAGINRFVFSSSASIYGAGAMGPIPEDFPKAPVSPYGRSKLMTELMLEDLSAATPAFRVMSLRYFNVGGADPAGRAGQRNPDTTGLIPLALDAALGVRPYLEVCGDDYDTRDGTGERDYIHIADLADAHGAALDYLAGQGTVRAMNLGYGRGSTVLEVVKTLESVLGRKLPWRLAPRRAGDPAVAVSDVSRLHQTLDWRPRFDSLELILRSALAWRTGDSSLRAPLSLQRRLDQIGRTAATAP